MSFDVKSTHRGPILDSDIIMKTQDLFIAKNPVTESFGKYTFAYSYQIPGEQLLTYEEYLFTSKNLFELKQNVRKNIKKYTSLGINLLFADHEGNIGF